MDHTIRRLAERLHRRVQMLLAPGQITLADDSGQAQKLQVRIGAHELRDGLPRLAEYGFSSVPQAGADALVLFIAGDRSNGVVVSTGDQRSRPRNLAAGEVAIYDDQGQSVHITRGGLAAGVLFQTAAMPAASPAQPAVAFPLHVTGFARLTAAETSATRSPTVWIDGSPIPDVTGRPWPMSNADILALAPKASTYYQKVGTYAAQLLSQIEAGQNPGITLGWPSNA